MKNLAYLPILLVSLVILFSNSIGQTPAIKSESKATDNTAQIKNTVNKKGKGDKKIAITFDNLPGDQIYTLEERREISRLILSALKKHKASAAGFVVGENVQGEDWESIVNWLEEGHVIGFHTYSGQELYGAPLTIFLDDLIKGKEAVEDLVATYRQKGRYFRFPFLHYATDEKMKELIIEELVENNIRIAHASIVVEDFVFNMSLEKIYYSRDSLKVLRFREEYFAHLQERLGYYETVAMEVAGRPVNHIIQFRANRLNAVFLDDILTGFTEMGYQFVTLRQALTDKVYRKNESYFGTMGLSYLDRIKYSE
jgi:peptidoglycan/xylan/chitin deacetylase (PgdA/CDA1 family)